MMKYKLLFSVLFFAINTGWSAPVFNVTPLVAGQTQLVQGQQGTYIYQITNNTRNSLNNIGLVNLPASITAFTADSASNSCTTNPSTCQYCSFPLSLASQGSCLIKLNINSNQIASSVQ